MVTDERFTVGSDGRVIVWRLRDKEQAGTVSYIAIDSDQPDHLFVHVAGNEFCFRATGAESPETLAALLLTAGNVREALNSMDGREMQLVEPFPCPGVLMLGSEWLELVDMQSQMLKECRSAPPVIDMIVI